MFNLTIITIEKEKTIPKRLLFSLNSIQHAEFNISDESCFQRNLIKEFNVKALELFKIYQEILFDSIYEKDDCIRLSFSIDLLILKLAKASSFINESNITELTNLKEFSWELLEELDVVCLKRYEYSIW